MGIKYGYKVWAKNIQCGKTFYKMGSDIDSLIEGSESSYVSLFMDTKCGHGCTFKT